MVDNDLGLDFFIGVLVGGWIMFVVMAIIN